MSNASDISTCLANLLDFVRLARKQHPHLILNLYAVAEFTAAAKAALPGASVETLNALATAADDLAERTTRAVEKQQAIMREFDASQSRVEVLRRDIAKLMEVSDIEDLTAARDFLDARTNLVGLPT